MLVCDQDIAAFEADGAVCLRGVFSADWIEQLRAGTEEALSRHGPYASVQSDHNDPGFFYTEYFLWRRLSVFRDFALGSTASEVASRLLGCDTIRYFYDGLSVKEPNTAKPSQWHQDQPYYPVDGKLLVIWTPMDAVKHESSLRIIRGSHQWKKWFRPVLFKGDKDMERPESHYEPLPDVDAEPERYEVLSWDVEPGDCVAFHGFALHGARGNATNERRRALSTTWLGDDAVYAPRPGELEKHFQYMTAKIPGERLTDDRLFPLAWPKQVELEDGSQ